MKMTGNKIFLDSSIIIELFAGNQSVADKINQLPQFYISSIVLGELYIGINRVVNKQKHLQKLNSFLELCMVLHIDETTASLFGEIVADLFKRGNQFHQTTHG
jgi:tRNA(fMet)-specific endonuclease VapC